MTARELMIGCEHDGSYIPVREVERLMKEYARIKCLEATRNTRDKSIIIVGQYYSRKETGEGECGLIQRDIQNIPNQDVMPEL